MDDPFKELELLEIQTSSNLPVQTVSRTVAYRELLKHWNITSFSQLENFYRCPRKFQKAKEAAAFEPVNYEVSLDDVHTTFGGALGAGIQHYLAHKNYEKALFAALMAWDIPFDLEIPKKKKSIWNLVIAFETFVQQVMPNQLDEWELLILPNGKPAIEISISLHCPEGFKHYGHIDIILRHKQTKRLAVVDAKSSGLKGAEESLYGNSYQALSYAIILDAALQEEVVDYEVFYLVYSTSDREWTLLPFSKSFLDHAEFIRDLLLTQSSIRTYRDLGFFPKRGQACFDYFRRCQYYGECDSTSDQKLPTLADQHEAEATDYVVQLTDVVENLKRRRKLRQA